MHIEGLNTQQIRKSELHTNSLAFGAKPITTSVGQRITDKALKILGAAAASITAATIALSKKDKSKEGSGELNPSAFVSSIATDKDLAEIHKIDLEAFNENYGIFTEFEDYKRDLKEQNITTYVIKSADGDIVGYYQLEPVEDGELYIYSMGVREDLRAKRASVAILDRIRAGIMDIAEKQEIKTVALDVYAENKPLVKLYKKLGFQIVDKAMVLKEDGMRFDYHMEIDVEKYFADLRETTQEEPEIIDYSKMSDEQIEEIANEIRKDPFFQQKMPETRLNRHTIPIVMKILSNKDAFNFLIVNRRIAHVISDSAVNENVAKSKLLLLDRFLGNKDYKKLPVSLFDYLLCNIYSSSQVELLDKFLSDETFSQKSDTNEMFSKMLDTGTIAYTITRIFHDKQAEIVIRILDDEDLKSNQIIMSRLPKIIHATKLNSDLDSIMECFREKRIISSEKGFDIFLDLLSTASTDAQVKFIKKIVLDERLCNYDYLEKSGVNFVISANNEKALEVKEKFIEKYLSDEKYYNNENLRTNILSILSKVVNEDNLYAKMDMIEEIFSDERLYTNKNILDNLNKIINNTQKMYDSVARTEMIKKIFSDERIANNESVCKNFAEIIIATQTEAKLRANILLIDSVLADETFLNNPILQKSLGYLLGSNNTNVYSKEQIKTLLNLLEVAFKKKHILKVAGEDISEEKICKTFGDNIAVIHSAVEMIGETNLIHAYGMKLNGVVEFAKTIYCLKHFSGYNKILTKFNPEGRPEYIMLAEKVAELKKTYPQIQAKGDPVEIKELQREIATCTKRMQEIRKSKVKLDPQQVLSKVRTLAIIASVNPFVLNDFIDLIQDGTKENEKIWMEKVYKLIFEALDIEYDEKLSQRLNLISSKYLPEILSSNQGFKNGFKKITELIKNNPDKTNEEIFNMLPQNIKTREMFETFGIDYEKWSRVDKDSFVKVEVKLSVEEARKAAIKSIEEEFNNVAFYSLPSKEINKIFDALKKIDVETRTVEEPIWDENGFRVGSHNVIRLFKNGDPIAFKDLSAIMKAIKDTINSNDFWTTSTGNPELDSYKDTIYTHLMKDRDLQYRTAKDLKEDSVTELEIRKTDMNNISHALFLGNHGACCTAVGTGGNQFSAPTYIMNKMISAIEIVDQGNYVGNTMCYIALVDGVPSLVLDNIELKADYHNNDKIRDAIVEYAKKLCAEIGKPDMPIYAGPYRHKLRMEKFESSDYRLQLIGSSGEDDIYLDFITAHREVTGKEVDRVKLYKIR